MGHERDERWAYVVLAILIVAYIVYRGLDTSWFSGLSVRIPDIKLGSLSRNFPYLFAPLFAVLSEIWRRRKAKALRAEWEQKARTEGLRREAEDVSVKFVSGARGSIRADVYLTRSALYVIDRAGRRGIMRFGLLEGEDGDYRVAGVSLEGGGSRGVPRLRVKAAGPSDLEFEMASADADGWWVAVRGSLGMSTERDADQSAAYK